MPHRIWSRTVTDSPSGNRARTLPPAPATDPGDLCSPAEARAIVGVSTRTFERYVSAGLLTPYRRTPTARRRFSAAEARRIGQHRANGAA